MRPRCGYGIRRGLKQGAVALVASFGSNPQHGAVRAEGASPGYQRVTAQPNKRYANGKYLFP